MSALLVVAAVILILLFVVLDAVLASNGLAPTFEIVPDPAGNLPF